LRACLDVVLRARAEGCEGRAGVVFFEAVFEAVSSVAAGAVDALRARGVYEGLAGGVGAL